MATRTVTLRLDDEIYREFREAAEAENRPLSNLIETAALGRIREQQFAADAEMAEIHGDRKLVCEIDEARRVVSMTVASHRG